MYFSLLIMAWSAFSQYLIAKDIVQNGFSVSKIFVFIFFGWVEICVYNFIAAQRIEITNNQLIVQFSFVTGFSLPKPKKQQIRLSDVESVTIARREYFEEHAEEFRDKGLKKVIDVYRNPFNRGIITRNTPLMYIALKNKSSEGITITTKPFSKAGFKKLIQEFKKEGISIVPEPVLGLQ